MPLLTQTAPNLARLLAMAVVANLFVMGLAGVFVFQSHQQQLAQARITTQNLAAVLESDLVNAIRRVDVSLQALIDIHQDFHLAGRMSHDFNLHIERVKSRIPEALGLRTTDAAGILRYGTGVDPAARLSLADRPHFQRLRDDPMAGLVISKPQMSRVDKKWVIVLARRINLPDGRFGGMIFATVSLDFFTQVFANMDLGPRGSVFLRDADMGLIARHPTGPMTEKHIGQVFVSPELQALLRTGQTQGTFFTAATPDGVKRTVSFRKLVEYPLYAFAGMAEDDYLAGWRRDSARVAVLVALFLLATAYATAMQARALRRQREDQALLRSQEALYHELVEDTPVLVVRYRPDTRILFANKAFAEFVGRPPAELTDQPWLDCLASDADRDQARDYLAGLTPARPVSVAVQRRMRDRAGQARWTQWTDRAVFDAEGRLSHLQSVGEDFTERKRDRDIQAARLRLMEFAVEHTMHELLVATLDEAGLLTDSPIGFYHFLAPDQKTLTLQAWSTRTSREYCHANGGGLHYGVDEAGVWVEAIRQRKPVIHNDYASLTNKRGLPQGHAELIREMVVPVFRKGLIVAILGVGNKAVPYTDADLEAVALLADLAWDFAESKRLEAELVALATTDFLTGLSNRRQFMTRMEEELARLKRFDLEHACVLMLDLDHFKAVNDQYGHAAGDTVLRHFAGILGDGLREIDTGGRLGGEEFGILLIGADLEDARTYAERLRGQVAASPARHEGQPISVTVSIGITALTAQDSQGESALKRADAALYQAKREGRNRVCVVTPA